MSEQFDAYEDQDTPPRRKSSGVPVWLILVILFGGSVVLCCPLSIAILLPAVQKVREAAARTQSSNNMKVIGLTVHGFHDKHGRLPRGFVPDPSDPDQPRVGKSLAWRVNLLPYMEQDPLYRRFDLSEPWDSPTNRPLADTVVREYADNAPGYSETDTRDRGFVGPGTIFDPGEEVKLIDIEDGLSNTILCAEAGPVPWPQYNEIPFAPGGPLPVFGQPDAAVFLVLFADGSVRAVSKSVDADSLHKAITRNGNDGPPKLD